MRDSLKLLVGGGLVVALGLALLAGPFANDAPDGLNRVAIEKGFADSERKHALDDSPVAGYDLEGMEGAAGPALAGVIGVLVTFGTGVGLFGALRAVRGRRRETASGGRR